MELKVKRDLLNAAYTLGQMSIDGVPFCYTVEDVVRPAGAPKVFGQTAIPAGTYKVIINHSEHFNMDMPLLIDVPGFEGVRIHSGNTAADTEGCIIIGAGRTPNGVELSRVCFTKFMAKIQGQKDITLTIG